MSGRQRLATRFAAADVLLVFLLLAITAILAGHYGWLNDDALNYVSLGEHISQWQHIALRPDWGDKYWAVFPLGYPAVIALFNVVLGDAFIAAKFANFCLIFASVLIATHWLKLPLLIVAPLFMGATMLEILSYSWSENLFIFAHILALAALSAYLKQGTKTALFCYVAGLLLVASSRYIGGFTLLGYLLVLAAGLGHEKSTRLFAAAIATGLCGLVFGGYLYFNLKHTGFVTGMERIPAPESVAELFQQFGMQLLVGTALLVPSLMVLFSCRARPAAFDWHRYKPAFAPVIIAVFYLVVLFVLRSNSRFEQFSGRLLAPGLILLWLGFLHIVWEAWRPRYEPGALARNILLITFIVNMLVLYRDFIPNPELARSQSAANGLAKYEEKYGELPDGTVIISAGYDDPTVSWKMLSPIFSEGRVIYLVATNYTLPLAEYKAYLSRLRYKEKLPTRYVFDFTEFASIGSFEMMLKRQNTDNEVANWIKSYFSPHSWVECSDCKPQ